MKKSKNKKDVAVLFSSGLDSTYLVYKNLEEGNDVTPVYIEIKNNENKAKIEKQNVKMLYKLFRKKYHNINSPKFVVAIDVNVIDHSLIFSQVPIWIFGMMYMPLTRFDEIHIGYVANDDAISYAKEIQTLFNAYKWLCHKPEKFPKLKFPLLKHKKYQMVDELPEEYKPFVTSCENPKLLHYYMKVDEDRMQFFEPCGQCDPCKRIIRDQHPYNSLYKKLCRQYDEKVELGERMQFLNTKFPTELREFEDSMYRKKTLTDLTNMSKEVESGDCYDVAATD